MSKRRERDRTQPEVNIVMIDDGLRKQRIQQATEIVLGRAHIVVAEGDDGVIGIGNLVRRRTQEGTDAREKCLEHAIVRVRSLREKRAQQEAGREPE